MKVLRKTGVIVLNSFEGGWNKTRNMKVNLIQMARVLILIIAISVYLTSCATTNRITPLMISSREGDIKVVKELIAKGADVNAKDNAGYTALIFASREVMSRLLKSSLPRARM